jgi:uridylate kinase
MINPSKFKRVLIKLSGEALMGNGQYGHDIKVIDRICREVKDISDRNIEVCLVVGGGNIYRGISSADSGVERASADYMGMLATVINALSLQNSLEKIGVLSRVLSAIPMTTICEPYVRRKAIRHMEKGRIVIFAAGTGNPFFTTDTAASLRAIEMGCDVLLKGTNVDGVYSDDPHVNKEAKRYEKLSYSQVLNDNLKVMDASAISLARENNLPIMVFSIRHDNELVNIFLGKGKYTLIS